MRPRRVIRLAALAVALAWPAGACRAAPAAAPSDERIDRAVAAAQRFLLSRIGNDGRAVGETDPNNCRYGGRTALLAQALLWARTDPAENEKLARSIEWLGRARLSGTYAVAARAGVWGLLDDANSIERLKRDAVWLIRAANVRGAYTYTSSEGLSEQRWDNSNSQFALLGISAAIQRGLEIPPAYLRRVERHWLDTQQADGGWGYLINPVTGKARSYGSMTAAGLASLYVCLDQLHGEAFLRCAAKDESKAAGRAIEWLGQHFDARENPRKGVQWYVYWLYSAARAGISGGHRYFGGHDWFAEGAAALLGIQNPDGSFGYGDRVAETAFAMMFLIRGQGRALVSKLQYRGRWNPRPRDAANLARWMGRQFERPMIWQIVGMNSPLAHWSEAPVLYISGAGAMEIDAPGIEKLRRFVQRGGTILSEAACGSGDFTIDISRLYAKMFPGYPLIRLPAGHAVYSAYYKPEQSGGASPGGALFGVTNGVRLLAVHSPQELSLTLQTGPRETSLPIFRRTANVWAYATGQTMVRPRGDAWPEPSDANCEHVVRVARLAHKANCDPEPLAWERFARRARGKLRLDVQVSPPMPIAKLDANAWPVAHITGTDMLKLSAPEKVALTKFFADGGTLIGDAAGGSSLFAKSFAQQVGPLAGGDNAGRLAQDHAVYKAGPHPIERVRYNSQYAMTLGETERTIPQLQAVFKGDRPVILFSEQDITSGLLGVATFGLKGYSPDSAERLMTNMLFYAGGLNEAKEEEEEAEQ